MESWARKKGGKVPKLIFLGTSNAIPDEDHENTHMAVVGEDRFVLIDCVNNPIVRIKQAGLDVHKLADLILTHFHPDHVSGVPSLLMNSWLLGRSAPLQIYGLEHTLERVEKMMDFYEWCTWPNFFPVSFPWNISKPHPGRTEQSQRIELLHLFCLNQVDSGQYQSLCFPLPEGFPSEPGSPQRKALWYQSL